MSDTTIQANAPRALDQTRADTQADTRVQTTDIETPDDAIAYTNATQGGSVQQDPAHVATAKLQVASDRATTQAYQAGGDVTRTQAAFESAAVRLDVQYPTRFVAQPASGDAVTLDAVWRTDSGQSRPSIVPVDFDGKETGDAVDASLKDLEDPATWADPGAAKEQNLRTIADAAKKVADAAVGADDPQAAARFIREQLPKIQAAADANYNSGAEFENKALLEQLARMGTVAKKAGDTQLIQDLLDLAKGNPELAAIAAGNSRLDAATALEGLPFLIELDKTSAGKGVLDHAVESIQADTSQLVQEYAKHAAGLAWCIENLGANASPQAIESAIKKYLGTEGVEAQNALVTRGKDLLTAVQQLRTQLPEGEARSKVEKLLSSTTAQAAVAVALGQHPELAAGKSLVETRDWLAGGGEGSSVVATSLGLAYVQHEVGKVSDPGQLSARLEALAKEEGLATSLGVSQDELNTTLGTLGKAVLGGDVTNQALDGLGKGNATLGRLLGSVGAALSAKGVVDDVRNGEWGGAALNGISAAAGVLAVTGVGTVVAGAISAAAALARLHLDTVNESNKHETPEAKAFLEGLGYSGKAAEQLINTTSSGKSAVSLLQQYTTELGLSQEDAVKFINHLASNHEFKPSSGPGATTQNALQYLVEQKLHKVLDAGKPDSISYNSASDSAKAFIREQVEAWKRAGKP